MIVLLTNLSELRMTTTSAEPVDAVVHYQDRVGSGLVEGPARATVSAATTTTILTVGTAQENDVQRVVRNIAVRNRGAALQTVTLLVTHDAVDYLFTPAISLEAGESLMVDEEGRINVYDVDGVQVVAAVATSGGASSAIAGYVSCYTKTGGTSEAAGVNYCFGHVAGNPGAWDIGTPGLNGRAPDGTAIADFGCFHYKNATTGANYLTDFKCSASVLGTYILNDFVWVNSGISGTTTSDQAISSVAFAARDLDGSANGRGYGIALYFYTAAGSNAGLISGSTVDYTNSEGTSGRTATLIALTGRQIPVTPARGTWIPFNLQDGDVGVKSIEGIVLATSLGVANCAHLVVYRQLAIAGPSAIYNVGASFGFEQAPGVRLYDGTCAHIVQWATATTATVVVAAASIMER